MRRLAALCVMAGWALPTLAGQPASAPVLDETVRQFLRLAQAEANAIEDEDEREASLVSLAAAMADAGDARGAMEIARGLKGLARFRALRNMATFLAWRGDANAALAAELAIPDPNWRSPQSLGVILSDKDLPIGLKILAGLPGDARDSGCVRIVKRRVLSGDLETAERVLSMISDPNTAREEAEPWLAVGRVVRDAERSTASRPSTRPNLNEHQSILWQVLEARAKAGQIRAAEALVGELMDARDRAGVLTAIARHHLTQGRKGDFRAALQRALRTAEALSKADPNDRFLMIGWAARCMDLASLLVESGDLDEAVRFARSAHDSLAAADDGLPIPLAQLLAGKGTIPYLLVRADLPMEALRRATLPDGKIDPDCIPLLAAAFAEAGNLAMAQHLYEQVAGPKERFQVALQAATAAIQKRREKAKDSATQPGS